MFSSFHFNYFNLFGLPMIDRNVTDRNHSKKAALKFHLEIILTLTISDFN